uniref:Protein kinase domain-containing protein n=1 Tax=Macrostomum lignano TaxID=282301 RepID=A0A1I8F2E5_9PLAT
RPWPSRPQASGDHLFVFGGESPLQPSRSSITYDDIWSWDRKVASVAQVTPARAARPPVLAAVTECWALKRPHYLAVSIDNGRTFAYFNDLWSFDLDTRESGLRFRTTGSQPQSSGLPACCFPCLTTPASAWLAATLSGLRNAARKGLEDLQQQPPPPQQQTTSSTQFAWQPVKFSGQRPTPRCGVTGAVNPSTGRAYTFGGVFDIEQADDGLTGVMFNELYQLDLVKQRWRLIDFGSNDIAAGGAAVSAASILPLERINAGLAVLDDRLYLYGGIYEGDDRAAGGSGQGWSMILPPTAAAGYQSDESESSDEDAGEEEAEDEDKEEATEADDGHEATPPPPPVVAGESVESYSTRTDSYWSRAVGNSLRRCWPASDVTESLVANLPMELLWLLVASLMLLASAAHAAPALPSAAKAKCGVADLKLGATLDPGATETRGASVKYIKIYCAECELAIYELVQAEKSGTTDGAYSPNNCFLLSCQPFAQCVFKNTSDMNALAIVTRRAIKNEDEESASKQSQSGATRPTPSAVAAAGKSPSAVGVAAAEDVSVSFMPAGRTVGGLAAALVFGCAFTLVVAALSCRVLCEAWSRRHYSKLRYLDNGGASSGF